MVDKNEGPCGHVNEDGHDKDEYIELDESAAEFSVEETNKKEGPST